MRTFAQKPKTTQQITPAKSTARRRECLGQSQEVNSILHLQRTIGNHAVQRMLQTHPEELKIGLTRAAPPHFGHDFSRIPVSLPNGGAVQTKLAINKRGDEYEQEADWVADAVRRSADRADTTISHSPPKVQKKCAVCASGKELCPKCAEEDQVIQRQPLASTMISPIRGQSEELEADAGLQDSIVSLTGSGQPLRQSERDFFEPRFGHDFGQVRVHTDARAAETARAVNARAYTIGRDIVFGQGEYEPGTNPGLRLLAHELAHVVQQSRTVNPVLQRQPLDCVAASQGVNPEKWSPDLERRYRRRGDTNAADAIRACCIEGHEACSLLLTSKEVWQAFEKWKVSGQVKLPRVAAAAPVAALVAPLPAPPPPTPSPPVSVPPGSLPGGPANQNVQIPQGTPANTNAPKSISSVRANVTAAAPVVIYLSLAAADLYDFGVFQRELIKAGYIILDDPVAICIQGCHTAKPALPPKPFPFSDLPPTPDLFERPDPDFMRPNDDLLRWIEKVHPAPPPETTPRTDPVERRRRRRNCAIVPMFPLGGNKEHDALAAHVTGAPVEYLVTTPDGLSKQFDGKDETETLYEVKTKHDFLQLLDLPELPLTAKQVRALSNSVPSLRADINDMVIIAEECGYDFRIATNNRRVLELLRDLLGDIIEPDKIEWEIFTLSGEGTAPKIPSQ